MELVSLTGEPIEDYIRGIIGEGAAMPDTMCVVPAPECTPAAPVDAATQEMMSINSSERVSKTLIKSVLGIHRVNCARKLGSPSGKQRGWAKREMGRLDRMSEGWHAYVDLYYEVAKRAIELKHQK